jgi:hypothetical protein
MPTAGETTAFIARPWNEVAAQWSEVAKSGAPVEHVVAIVNSVIAAGATDKLAAAASTYDLTVTTRPLPEPPYSVVTVRSPRSVRPPAPGKVVIEHRALTGRLERIERPVADAVPLFWRFMVEKFGVSARPGRT